MIITYTLIGLIIYSCIVFIIGLIKLKDSIKKYILLALSSIYNFFIYLDI